MITRPLDLASRLRPAPRSFDGLFFVNIGALVLFFALFGSHFVLAPGLSVNFRLPAAACGHASAKAPTHVISVLANGQIFTSHGAPLRTFGEMPAYFAEQARSAKDPVLLVRGDATVPNSRMVEITSAAQAAGFEVMWAASEPAGASNAGGR